MIELIYILLCVALAIAVSDFKTGMLIVVFVGCFQDVLRKLIVDAPVYITALVILFIVITYIGAQTAGKLLPMRTVPGWNNYLRSPLQFFFFWVFVQSTITLIKTGSLVLSGIGLTVYLLPILAFMLAFSFASNINNIIAFLWVYVAVSAAMLVGVYLSYFGFDWEILQSVGEAMVVYSWQTGAPISLPSGFFRQPEVAAWHGGAGVCLSVILILGIARRELLPNLFLGMLVIFFIGAVMLTGRRKFLVEIIFFVPILFVLLRRFRIVSKKYFAIMTSGFVVLMIGFQVINPDFLSMLVDASGRGVEGGVFLEIFDRMSAMTYHAILSSVQNNGFLGVGAGMGSGGAQYYLGENEGVGWSAEGGLGKIVAELGVPGLVISAWLIFSVVSSIGRTLDVLSKGDSNSGIIGIGISAFLLANVFVFVGAAQVYSDLFILWLLGSCLGFVFGIGKGADENRVAKKLVASRGGSSISSTYARNPAT